METIKNYLDNMFAGLPKTTKVIDLKGNILSNMEEKYNELKRQGKSENEAIGIVISEFGNIDELVNELGIRKDNPSASLPLVTNEEVENYLFMKKTLGKRMGFGVFLFILGPALLVLISSLLKNGIIANDLTSKTNDIPGVIIMLVIITIAVGIFIYTGMSFERYQYMEKGVQIPANLEVDLKQRYAKFSPTFSLQIIVSTCMLVLSPITIFIAHLIDDSYGTYGVVSLLFIVGVAIYMMITAGTVKESYEQMLKSSEYAAYNKEPIRKEDKVIGAVASIVWPLAVLVFLYYGFSHSAWGTAWIIFPITGILFGMFCAAYSIMTEKANS